MTLIQYLLLSVSFVVTSFGLGLPLARRLTSKPMEQLCAAPMIGLVISFIATFLLFINFLPMKWFALAAPLGAVGLLLEHKSILGWWMHPDTRSSLLGWMIVAAWTQFLAMCIVSFNGGAWGGDWLEHHQRAIFFRDHLPLRFIFIGDYLLTARPPLVNAITAGYQSISVNNYACDQVIIGLWCSLVFLPVALFCHRAGGKGRAYVVLTVLFLLNPSFLENTTFAWTKLPTAFFILIGAYFLLFTSKESRNRSSFAMATIALTAALLAHYSAGPFCVVLVAGWIVVRCRENSLAQLAREIPVGFAFALPLLALWFGWACAAYGVKDTFLSNSSVIEAGPAEAWAQISKVSSNIVNSIVPHPFRTVDYSLIHQASEAGWFRDYFFMIVQVNVFFLMGTGGAFAMLWAIWRTYQQSSVIDSSNPSLLIGSGVFVCILIGIAVHGAADEWGLAHICLQPLGLLGLALLAARFKDLGPVGISILSIGLMWDASVNVGLHYWLQTQTARPEWFTIPNLVSVYKIYGPGAFNACLKAAAQVRFLSDTLPGYRFAAPLAVMLGAALVWWRARPISDPTSKIS